MSARAAGTERKRGRAQKGKQDPRREGVGMGCGLTDEGRFAIVILAGIIHVLVRVPVRDREAGGVENYDGFPRGAESAGGPWV